MGITVKELKGKESYGGKDLIWNLPQKSQITLAGGPDFQRLADPNALTSITGSFSSESSARELII